MQKSANKKPFAPKWFWDFDYGRIDWHTSYKTIIARMLERGGKAEWEALVRFYSREKILTALEKEIVFLPDHTINEVSVYFNLPKESMLSYKSKQEKPGSSSWF